MKYKINQKRSILVSQEVHETLTMLKYSNRYNSINTVIRKLLNKELSKQLSLFKGEKESTQ